MKNKKRNEVVGVKQTKMKRKNIIATLTVVVCATNLFAQEPNTTPQENEQFSKQIEIEKDYSAGITQAERLEMEPRMLDTTIVRPKMKYSLLTIARESNFGTEKITPVELSTAKWERPNDFYLNVGAGAPLQSEADLYWTPVQSRGRLLTVAVNHEGFEGKLTNLDQQRLSALTLKNRVAMHGTMPLKGGAKVVADVDWQGVVANPYGSVGVAERSTISNNAAKGDVKLSGRHSDKLSYVARLRGNYAVADMAPGKAAPEDGNMWRFCADYTLGGLDSIRKWLPGVVTLYYYGVRSEGLQPYFDTSVTLIPQWSLRAGKWLPIEIMAGYDYIVHRGAKQSWKGLIGSVKVSWERNPLVVPYLFISNDIDAGLMAPALWNNPYHNLMPTDSRKIYRAEAGANGVVPKWNLAYDIKGGYAYLSRYFYTTVVEGSPVLQWGVDGEGVSTLYAEAGIEWSPLRNLVVEGQVVWNHLMPTTEAQVAADHAYSHREWQGELGATYSPIKRLKVGVNVAVASAAEAQLLCTDGTKQVLDMPAYVDLGVQGEYELNGGVSVWLRGDNLLNQEIYQWASYRCPGIGARAGVRVTF